MEADDEALSVTQQDYLQEMMKAGRHLLDLIDEVLDLARIEAGKLQLIIDTVYLPEVISECHALIEPLAAERNLHLEFCASHCSNVWVQADRMRLKQILLNLLSNAIKYNREAGEITLTCQEEADSLLRLTVCDTGEGIPEDKLHQLYEAFNRLGAENSNIEGTGIGLMISRRMIEMMGGSLAVTSKVGEGSCFSFTVPLSKEQY
jgi:signal transduction histidine kinase